MSIECARCDPNANPHMQRTLDLQETTHDVGSTCRLPPQATCDSRLQAWFCLDTHMICPGSCDRSLSPPLTRSHAGNEGSP